MNPQKAQRLLKFNQIWQNLATLLTTPEIRILTSIIFNVHCLLGMKM